MVLASRSPRRRWRLAFVILEVLVAVVIIGVAVVALMKGFIVALDSMKRVRRNEQAIVLAKSFMDDLILEPPAEDRYEGNFADDPRYGEEFAGWKWKLQVEEEEPDYEERPDGSLLQELEAYYPATLEIIFEEDRQETVYLELYTILMAPEIFTNESLQTNQMF